jgi:hypothetical protein
MERLVVNMDNTNSPNQSSNQRSLKAFVASTLTTCRSTAFDVDTNLRLLDRAWEAQKQIWASQEFLAF